MTKGNNKNWLGCASMEMEAWVVNGLKNNFTFWIQRLGFWCDVSIMYIPIATQKHLRRLAFLQQPQGNINNIRLALVMLKNFPYQCYLSLCRNYWFIWLEANSYCFWLKKKFSYQHYSTVIGTINLFDWKQMAMFLVKI